MDMYEVRYYNALGYMVTEFVKYPWQADELARELMDAEIWYKGKCVRAYKSAE